jgi:DNA polymerase III sliding clamp (beta) subunit (PCNA family)
MQATVKSHELVEALKKVSGIIKGKFALPVLAGVKIEFADGYCKLSTNNLEQWVSTSIKANGDNFSLIYSNVSELLKASKFFDCDVSFKFEDGVVTIESDGKSLKQRTIELVCAVQEPEIEPLNIYTINAETLLERYKKVKYAVATDETKIIHTGCIFRDNRIYCVDGYRLGQNTDSELWVKETMSVPLLAMEMLSIFKGSLSMVCNKKYVVFEDGVTTVTTKLFEGEALDDTKVMEKSFTEMLEFNVKDFESALSYLKTFWNKTSPVKFSNGKLSVQTSESNVESNFPIDKPSEIEIGFNLTYMEQALTQFKGEKKLKLGLNNSVSPMIITNGKQDSALVLPVRLNK